MPRSADEAVVAELMSVSTLWGRTREDLARLAVRRWRTYRRRHPAAKAVTHDDRVTDLAKAIGSHVDPTGLYNHPSDIESVARVLAECLARKLG